MMLVSCGTALHHARVALAAEGCAFTVDRLPDPADPDLLAVLSVVGRTAVTPEAIRLVQAAQLRRTDRRPIGDTPVPAAAVQAVRAAVDAEDLDMHVVTRDQLGDLAFAAAQAAAAEAQDPAIVEELTYWTGHSPEGTGLPASSLPATSPQTTVPGRDFGHPGTLAIGTGHDRAATYAVIFGPDDEPATWLRAGEAMSAAWLAATELGVSVVPMSGVIEVPLTRAALHRLLSGIGHAQIVLRLGIADPDHAGPPHTPRIPAAQVVDTSAVRP
jgi:nitroreductase